MYFKINNLFYFIFLCYLTACYTQDKNIGDSCKMPTRGNPGVCKKIADCPAAKVAHRMGVKPYICSRKGGVVVVCCAGAASRPPPETYPEIHPKIGPVANSFNNNPIPSNLRKCQQKCLEYSAPVTTTLFAAPLSIDREIIPTSISNCVFESKPLIYGGSVAEYGEFPHMALLGGGAGTRRTWYCGGTLISEQFVLSAAHCFQDRIENWRKHALEFSLYLGPITVVRLGELNIKKPELNSEPEDIAIEQIIKHPHYVRTLVYNDIALVKLVKKVTLSTYIRPACLWNKFAITETNAIATGWGTTENMQKMSEDLLKVGLNLLQHNACKESYKNYSSSRLREIRTSILCASNSSGGDTCQGDSGGPLQIVDAHNQCIHYIIGVTSAGRGCGSNLPGLYTRVSDYVDWIESVVWP